MKITVSGIVGSGKSTVAKLLAEKLNYQYYSVGGIMRQMAVERGLHLSELTEIAKSDGGKIDEELDSRQRDLNDKNYFVMDSRLGFYFIPDSYRVFLDVDIDEAARRIHGESRDEESYLSPQEAREHLEKRIASEKHRYKSYYGIEFPERCLFDLKIDTTSLSPAEVVEKILSLIPEKYR